MKQHHTTFDNVKTGGQFLSNGTHWVKRSSRTAALFGQPSKWFYFSKNDAVSVADKWLK